MPDPLLIGSRPVADRRLPGEVITETRRAQRIANGQVTEVDIWQVQKLAEMKAKYPYARFRTPFIPIYNCHGMSFASRRTQINDPREVRKIVGHDGYQTVVPEDVLPGDLVLYVDPQTGDAEHSGTVASIPDKKTGIVGFLVVSKWGHGPEVVHTLADCPYPHCLHQFYRITA